MSFDQIPPGDERTTVAASGEVIRLLVASALAVILLVGGVYWLHQHPAAPTAPPSAGATIGVQLVTIPDLEPTDIASVEGEYGEELYPGNEPSPQREAVITDDGPLAPVPDMNHASGGAGSPPSEAALRFREVLLQHIARYRRYPAVARAQRLEGTVQIMFRLRRDGTIGDAWVVSSSGVAILDTEAISTLRRAEPLPAIPTEMPGDLRIALPIAFSLHSP